MSGHLDSNIKKLLNKAPAPATAPEGAADRIFDGVTARLAEDRLGRTAATYRWVAIAAAAVIAIIIGISALSRNAGAPPERDNRGAAPAIARGAPKPAPAPVAPAPVQPTIKKIAPPSSSPVGEELSDGTVVRIAGGSEVEIVTWPDRVRPLVRLNRGEITCDVARARERFRVETPLGEAIALGTKFSVKLVKETKADAEEGSEQMIVSVNRGEVIVRDRAGLEQLAAAGETVKVEGQAVSKVVENWRSGQLVTKLEDGSQGEPLEVRKHHVKATIKEQIALVEVDQTFYNPTDRRMEGTFFFPMPHGATICRLAMYVGDNLMEGEIAETARARRTFEALMVQRIDPALLEWAGGNNFKMRVFPIEPKSEKRVLISYYQLLKKERRRIRFTYPLVSDSLNTHPVGEIDIQVTVSSTPKISVPETPGYEAHVQAGSNDLEVKYAAKKAAPTKDFQLSYEVARGQELVVVPFWHKKDAEGYFAMIFAPELQETDSEKEVCNRLIFVIDKSGGLGARHLKLAVQAVETALTCPADIGKYHFGMVAYDTFAEKFTEKLVPATPENLTKASAWLGGLSAMGASDLTAAWKAAAELAGQEQTQVIYVGSGMSSLTSTRTGKLLAAAQGALAEAKVSIHALPVGNVTDMAFLGELVREYNGSMRSIRSADDVAAYVPELMDDYGWPICKNARVEFSGVETAELYPVEFPNLTAGRQLFAFGKYLGQGTATVKLTAEHKDELFERDYEVQFGGDSTHRFVPRLWATRKIEHLQQGAALAEGAAAQGMVRTVIETSKRYRVMSQHTSFIVLETAEDYLRYGIERRRDEFSEAEEDGDVEFESALGFKKAKREMAAGYVDAVFANRAVKKPQSRANAPRAPEPTARYRQERQLRQEANKSVDKLARRKSLKSFAEEKSAKEAAKKQYAKRDSKDAIDVMAWARQDIFPTFGWNRLGGWPNGWKHGDPKALEILRGIASPFQSLGVKITTYSLDQHGKETKQGREWTVAFDKKSGAFYSRRLGDDHTHLCDGKTVAKTYPLLKYAAKRQAEGTDLSALAASLPGFLMPWTDRLDRDYLIRVKSRDEKGLVLELKRRHNQHESTLLYLSGEKGPITKIEVYKRRYDRGWKTYLHETILCEEAQDFGGVKVPTVFRIQRHTVGKPKPPVVLKYQGRDLPVLDEAHAKGLLKKLVELKTSEDPKAKALMGAAERELQGMAQAASGVATVIRLTDLEVNGKIGPSLFKIEIPKDWSVRDLDVQPHSGDRRPISHPVNPSPNMGGRRFR